MSAESVGLIQAITGLDGDAALALLLAANNNAELAIARHFDGPGVPADAVAAPQPPPVVPPPVDSEEDNFLVDPNMVVNDAKTGAIVPLSGLKVAARVNQTVADVSLSLRFENPSATHPIEAVFRLADEDIIVHDFEICVGDSIVQGQCMEKSEAFAKYDDAISSGNQAFLAEKKSKRQTFDISAGNLAPGMVCVVNVRYLTKLETVGDKFVFGLPSARTVPPPASTPARISASEEEKNAKLRAQVPNGLNITVAVTQPQRIIDLSCETHKCEIERLDVSGRVTLSQDQVSPARFEVEIGVQDANQPSCIVEAIADPKSKNEAPAAAVVAPIAPPQNDPVFDFGPQPGMNTAVGQHMLVDEPQQYKKYALSLSVVPRVQADVEVSTEIIFMVDCSGSMSGGRMRRAKSALQLFLRSLPESCTFNILAFGDRYHTLFEEPRQYSSETLEAANAWMATIDAKLGGTDLLRPFEDLLSSPLHPSFPVRQIFLLTDGDVKNKDAVLQCVRSRVGEATRIFALGIGNEVSQALLRGITKFGRGKAEFVESTTALEAPVMRQVTRALQPVLTKFRVDWNTLKAPTKLAETHYPPAIFNGERFDFHSFFEAPVDKFSGEPTQTRHEIKIKAMAEQNEFEFPCIVDLSASDLELSVQRFAAHAEIRDMELSPNHSGLKKNIIELATKYHLASKYTSFVAIHVAEAQSAEGHMIHMDVDESIADSKAKDSGLLAQAGEKLEEIGSRLGGMLRTSGNFVSGKLDQIASIGGVEGQVRARRSTSSSYHPQQQQQMIADSMMDFEDDSDGLASSEEEDRSFVRSSQRNSSFGAASGAAFAGYAGAPGGGRGGQAMEFKKQASSPMSAPAAVASDFAEKMVNFGAAVAEKMETLFSSGPASAAAPAPAPVMATAHRGFPEEEMSQVKEMMESSIDSLLERGEKLELLSENTNTFESRRPADKKRKASLKKEHASKREEASPPPPPPAASAPAPPPPTASTFSFSARESPIQATQAAPSPTRSQAAPKKPVPRSSGLPLPSKAASAMDIVIHAQANGGFHYNDVLAALLGKSFSELDAKKPAEATDEMWATALAVAALEKLFAATKDEWSLVATKARKYIAKLIAAAPSELNADSLVETASTAL